MAHECPECGMQCHCNGDIDDCCFNFEEDVLKCTHFLECEQQQEMDEDYSD